MNGADVVMFAQFLRARSRLNPVIYASAVKPYTRILQYCLYAHDLFGQRMNLKFHRDRNTRQSMVTALLRLSSWTKVTPWQESGLTKVYIS